jgi:hypothetical protein
MVAHPRAASLAGRVLTAPVVRGAISGAWGLYWNDLVHGASPSRHRTISALMSRSGAAAVARSPATAWFVIVVIPAFWGRPRPRRCEHGK